jgi:hypothetical protein
MRSKTVKTGSWCRKTVLQGNASYKISGMASLKKRCHFYTKASIGRFTADAACGLLVLMKSLKIQKFRYIFSGIFRGGQNVTIVADRSERYHNEKGEAT